MITEIGALNVRVESGTVISRVQIKDADENSEGVEKVRVLLPKAISDGIDTDALEEIYVSEKQLDAGKIRLTREGDIVIKLTTPYDAAYITEELSGIVVPSHCAVISNLLPQEMDAKYLVYVMSSPYGLDCLSSMTSGTATAMLKVRDIFRFPIPMLPLDEQQALGELYMAFQKKRTVLRQMLNTEKLAQDAMIMDAIRREG